MTDMKKHNSKRLSPAPANHAAAGDFLRVLCVGMIGWYHIWQQSWLSPTLETGAFRLSLMPAVRSGYMFVDLLLMLSGFLLYLPYANGKERAPLDFYRRRALRILPSYWLCLAVMLAFAILAPDFADGIGLAKDLAAHLTFTHNLFPQSYLYTRLNIVLWTLAVEVQFYLLLPALAPAFRKHPLIFYLAMVGAALCFQRLWTGPMADTTLFVNRLPNMLDVYANGMLAAHLYTKLAKQRKRRRGLVAALGTAACLLGAWGIWRLLEGQASVYGYDLLRQGQLDRRWLFSACGALFLAGGSLSYGPVRRFFSNRAVRFLSGISFNFYIWHQWLAVQLKAWRIPPYQAAADPNQAGEMPWQLHYTLICFAAALVVATLVTYLVEKPAGRWADQRLPKWEGFGKHARPHEKSEIPVK